MYSTVPPWLRTSPPLIDTVTGVPGQPFPADSSEVVSYSAGVRSLFTNRLLSEDLTENACLHHSFLQAEYTTDSNRCQVEENRQKSGQKCALVVDNKPLQPKTGDMLHNILRYVNKCNFFYNRLCFMLGKGCIFRWPVYIKYSQKCSKKLSKRGVLGKRLDFLRKFVIMEHDPY